MAVGAKSGGRVVLRIEDMDSPRVKPGRRPTPAPISAGSASTGTGKPSSRLSAFLYQAALQTLQQRELVYPCTCTRSDVERAASAPTRNMKVRSIRGRAQAARAADAAGLGDQPYCWRFRVPERSPEWIDGFLGPTAIDLRTVGGDFVVWKRRGVPATPAYQLAVVVDDAAQGVTEVVRGDDLIPSTPRQLLLYEALGLRRRGSSTCRWWSGRTAGGWPSGTVTPGCRRCVGRRDGGAAAGAAGVVVRLDRGDRPVTARELLPLFRLEAVPREPFVLTAELLRAIGGNAEKIAVMRRPVTLTGASVRRAPSPFLVSGRCP